MYRNKLLNTIFTQKHIPRYISFIKAKLYIQNSRTNKRKNDFEMSSYKIVLWFNVLSNFKVLKKTYLSLIKLINFLHNYQIIV